MQKNVWKVIKKEWKISFKFIKWCFSIFSHVLSNTCFLFLSTSYLCEKHSLVFINCAVLYFILKIWRKILFLYNFSTRWGTHVKEKLIQNDYKCFIKYFFKSLGPSYEVFLCYKILKFLWILFLSKSYLSIFWLFWNYFWHCCCNLISFSIIK